MERKPAWVSYALIIVKAKGVPWTEGGIAGNQGTGGQRSHTQAWVTALKVLEGAGS